MENQYINQKIIELWKDYPEEIRGTNWPVLWPEFKKDTILFVGLNPSLTKKIPLYSNKDLENEEKILEIIEKERKSMDKYHYFDPFKKIAKNIGFEENNFDHIDLFFYRETSSKRFMSFLNNPKNKEFKEDQLKISLDAISKTQPRVILVANKNASDIITNRFSDLIDDSNYLLNGFERIKINNKEIPIFFSGMISSARRIDDFSLKRLIWHLKKAREISKKK